MITEAEKNGKNIVIFVDDLDRCNESEIRQVITGLSTYIDPDSEGASVSIVTAIDGPKVVQSFDPDQRNGQKINILNKTFQIVLPVPSLSYENIMELIDKTADDLDYSISEDDRTRIARVSMKHGNSNLRIIRSALSDLKWIRKIARENMDENSFFDSKSYNIILDSDYLLYRISLIKLLSDNEDLRKFVSDASMWIDQNNRQGDIIWDLLDMNPEFRPSKLDPRPFFALNTPNKYVASVSNFDKIRSDLKSRSEDKVLKQIRKYDPATQIDIIYRILDMDMKNMDAKIKSTIIDVIIEVTSRSITAIGKSQYDIFQECMDVVSSKKVMRNISNDNYSDWLKLAKNVDQAAVNELISTNSPFFKRDKERFLRNISSFAVDEDVDIINQLLQLEIREINHGNEVKSSKRVSKYFSSDIIDESDEAPVYLLALLDNWKFESNNEQPPEELFNQNIIQDIQSEEHRSEAKDIFQKVGAQGESGRNFLDTLIENEWPSIDKSGDKKQ